MKKTPLWDRILFVPELVNSVTPADDIDGKLESFIKLIPNGTTKKIGLTYQVTTFSPDSPRFSQHEVTETVFQPRELRYALAIKTPLYGRFYDIHTYRFGQSTDGPHRGYGDIAGRPPLLSGIRLRRSFAPRLPPVRGEDIADICHPPGQVRLLRGLAHPRDHGRSGQIHPSLTGPSRLIHDNRRRS